MNEFVVLFLVFIATIFGAFGSLYLKKGALKLHWKLSLILKNHNLFLGVFLFLISSVFYIWALKQARLSLVYPVTSLTYVWVSFLSVRFLGEKMNKYKWRGIIFIIIGVFLITR